MQLKRGMTWKVGDARFIQSRSETSGQNGHIIIGGAATPLI